jgi:hypothetical protein
MQKLDFAHRIAHRARDFVTRGGDHRLEILI